MRYHDSLYLKENRYDKPKESHKHLFKILKKEINKKKNYRVLDVGCSNGELIYNLEKDFKNFNITGIDVKKELIKKAKKKLSKNVTLKIVDFNSSIKSIGKFDIIVCSGVVSIFDNLSYFVKNINKCLVKNGKVFLFESFNERNFDVILKYKDLKNPKFGYQSGWNIWSIATIKNYFKRKRFKIYKFNIDKNIKLDKTDLVRSWTIKIDNRRFFTNALMIIQNQMWIKIY